MELKIDHRGKLAEYLITEGVGTRCSLPLGDVEWVARGRDHLMELKTAHDLAVSLRRGHLQDQVARMERLDADLYLLIVGEYREGEEGWTVAEKPLNTVESHVSFGSRQFQTKIIKSWEQVRYAYAAVVNYLSHLQEDGWTVVNVHRLSDSPHAINFVSKRSQKTRRHAAKRQKPHGSLNPNANALRAVPRYSHLSSTAAQGLVERYWRDPLNLDGVSDKELEEIPGLGKVGIERIRNA